MSYIHATDSGGRKRDIRVRRAPVSSIGLSVASAAIEGGKRQVVTRRRKEVRGRTRAGQGRRPGFTEGAAASGAERPFFYILHLTRPDIGEKGVPSSQGSPTAAGGFCRIALRHGGLVSPRALGCLWGEFPKEAVPIGGCPWLAGRDRWTRSGTATDTSAKKGS